MKHGAVPESVYARLVEVEAYPTDPSAKTPVEWVQTHISHVFLTGDRVYKFRKAVDLGFVRFSTRAERNEDCLREVALNRRLAPDVYLGVAPLHGGVDTAWIGPPAEILAATAADSPAGCAPEHCVVMRRLAAGRDALSLLEAGRLGPEHLDRLAVRIARFHEEHRLGLPVPLSSDEWFARCTRPALENFDVLGEASDGVVAGEDRDAARQRLEAMIETHAPRFERRRRMGRAVDGHGDLHLQHVWFEQDDSDPLVIDCLEFNAGLRQIDAASEVAFTAMDLVYRNRPDLGERFLRRYARESDDFDLYSVVDYFISYRAAVRSKVAALAASDAQIDPTQREGAVGSAVRHLRLASEFLETRRPGSLVLIGGTVGTGKSTVAEALADRIDGVVVSSDRVRMHRRAVDSGRYSRSQRESVYRSMLERARPPLESGRTVLLDATFEKRAWRSWARDLARELGSPIHFVEVRADRARTLERLERRARAGDDPSEAGPERLDPSLQSFEPFDPESEGSGLVLRTDVEDWREQLAEVGKTLCGDLPRRVRPAVRLVPGESV